MKTIIGVIAALVIVAVILYLYMYAIQGIMWLVMNAFMFAM